MKTRSPRVRGRFYVVNSGDEGWDLVDDHGGVVVNFPSKRQALLNATFARAYVKRHGDITLYSFPYNLSDPLPEDAAFMNENQGRTPVEVAADLESIGA